MSAKTSRFESIAAPLALVAIVFAYWQPSWSAGLGHGDFPGHVALIETLARQLEEGPWFPLWASDWNGGSSLLFWYIQPLFSSYLLLPFVAWFGPVAGIRIGGTVFLAIAALAMYGLGNTLTRSRAAGFLAASFYVLHPSVASFVGEVGQIHQPVALAILPLLFWSWIAFARAPGLATGTAASATAALLFYDMERFWLTAPWAFLVYIAIAWRRGDDAPPLKRSAAVMGPALAAGLGMTLLVAFPTLPAWFERPLLQWHDLDTLDVFRDYYSFPHLFALLDRAGALAKHIRPAPGLQFVALPGQWYQGGVALAFVALGCLFARVRPARDPFEVRPGLIAAFLLAALAIAFGVHAIAPRHATLASLWSEGTGGAALVPLAGLFLVVWMGTLVVAGLPQWRDEAGRLRAPALGVAVVLLAVLLFGRPFVWLSETIFVYEHLRAPSHFAFPSLPLLMGLLAGLVAPRWFEFIGPERRWLAVGVITLLHLVDVAPYRFQPEWGLDTAKTDAWQEAFAALDGRAPGRLLDTHHYNPVTDLYAARSDAHTMAWGWLSWTSTREMGDLIKTGFFDTMRMARRSEAGREENTRMAATYAGLADVRHVVWMEGISPPMPATASFEPVVATPQVVIYENRLALGPVQFYDALAHLEGELAETVPLTAALARRGVATVRGDDLDAGPPVEVGFRNRNTSGAGGLAAAARPVRTALERELRPAAAAAAPCEMQRPGADRILLDCRFEQPGFVVVAEAWFPHWRVHRDGDDHPALRLNHAFLGAPVAAGPTRLEFRYHPTGATRFAFAVSAISWLAAAGLGAYGGAIALRRRSRHIGSERERETA